MDFNFNISELVSIIALLIAIIGGYVNIKIQITKLVEENKILTEKINNLDKKLSEICKKVDKIRIILAKEGINNDNE
jgi:regulator of replication initiation timing